jgi:hypothetical protein
MAKDRGTWLGDTTYAALSIIQRIIKLFADIMSWVVDHGTMPCMTLGHIVWDG